MRSSILFAARSGLAALAIACVAGPAAAGPVSVFYSFTYNPPADFPGGGKLLGQLQFFSEPLGIPSPAACGGPISLGPLGAGDNASDTFVPPDPCFGDPSRELLFTFSGALSTGSPPPKIYAVLDSDPFLTPPANPIFLGTADFDLFGSLVGFKTPSTSPGNLTGDWEIKVSAITITSLPEVPTLPLLAFGLGALLLTRRPTVKA